MAHSGTRPPGELSREQQAPVNPLASAPSLQRNSCPHCASGLPRNGRFGTHLTVSLGAAALRSRYCRDRG